MFVSQLRRTISAFSRFKRPVFRNVQNPNELLLDTQHLIRRMKINNANRSAFQQQAQVSVLDSFKLSRQLLETSGRKELKVSYFDQNNKQYIGTFDLKNNLKLDVDAVDLPVSSKINLKRHFTIDRGVLNIKETILTELQLGLVNLPNNATSQSIHQFIKPITSNVDISLSYCALGFPAYATLTFNNTQQLTKAKELVEQTFKYGDDRQVVVKTFQNNKREQIKNRRIAINGIQQGQNPINLLTELSKFGRVIHLDFPQIIRNNASKQQIYSQFQNSSQPIKIRTEYENGHVQQQYYPTVKKLEHAVSFQQTLYQGNQLQNQQYAQRLQYADTITIYPDSQQKILKSNRGYCLVLFNTTEQAQNCYFQLHQDYEIDLVQDHEFNYDKRLKQQLFRYIDNESIRRQAATVSKLDNPTTRPIDYANEMIKEFHIKLDDIAELELYQQSGNLELFDVDRYFGEEMRDTQQKSQTQYDIPEDKIEEEAVEAQQEQGEAAQGQQAEDPEQAAADQAQKEKQRIIMQTYPYSIANQTRILRTINDEIQHEQDHQNQNPQLSFDYNPQAERNSEDQQPQSLLDRILQKRYSKQKLSSNKKTLENLKTNKKVHQVGRTFSQLAELELFGTIVPPKKVSKVKSDIAFEYNPELQNRMKEIYDLSKYDIDRIEEAYGHIDNDNNANEDYHINKEVKKIQRYMKNHNGELPPDNFQENEDGEEGEEGEEGFQQNQNDEDGNNTPSAKFSTMRQQALYRKATQKQRQSQLIAYNSMVKKLINEYFGRFEVGKLKNTKKTYEIPTINLRQLKFSDGQEFLTEDDLPKILNFHYDQEDALSTFTSYHKIQEAFKSLPIGQRQKILSMKKQNKKRMALKLADIGVVEQIFEAQPQQVIDELNLYQSKLGESYQSIEKDGDQYMVKLIKNQPLFPLQQLKKLENFIQQPFTAQSQGFTQILQQAQNSSLFQALSNHGLSPQKIQQLLQQIVANTHTPLKVLQALMHLKNIQTFQADIQTQVQLQKIRLAQKPLTTQNMIKSPELNQQLQTKGKSKFVVSDYRQL